MSTISIPPMSMHRRMRIAGMPIRGEGVLGSAFHWVGKKLNGETATAYNNNGQEGYIYAKPTVGNPAYTPSPLSGSYRPPNDLAYKSSNLSNNAGSFFNSAQALANKYKKGGGIIGDSLHYFGKLANGEEAYAHQGPLGRGWLYLPQKQVKNAIASHYGGGGIRKRTRATKRKRATKRR